MDIYFKKRRWKQFLLFAAIAIGIGSIFYTNNLVERLSGEERQKAKTLAMTTSISASQSIEDFIEYDLKPSEDKYLNDIQTLISEILVNNSTIPVIVEDQKNFSIISNNFPDRGDKYIERELKKLKERAEPIVIILDEASSYTQHLYYKESSLLVALRYYPFVQLFVITILILVAYFAFSSSRKAEQDLVWIGMAKETAHQLGTPISSLMAWIELLKEENIDPNTITELTKDTERLQKITERFSKIGSAPDLIPDNIYSSLMNSVNYLNTRVSKKIEFKLNFDEKDELYIPLSSSLFSWVIENLVRNSVDAIENKKGEIQISVAHVGNEINIDVTDNGKGISKGKQKTIFNPGFTTKKRGWGLGLSLSKRIIENYHKGKLFLKSSEANKATTFRIVLRK